MCAFRFSSVQAHENHAFTSRTLFCEWSSSKFSLANLSLLLFLRIFRSFVFMILKELSRNVFHCSVINVRLPSKCKTDLQVKSKLAYFCAYESRFISDAVASEQIADSWVTLTCAVSDSFDILSRCFLFVKNFFNFFQVCFFLTFFFQKQLWYLITVVLRCQGLFSTFFEVVLRPDWFPRRNFDIIPPLSSFVNRFFHFFIFL